MARGRGGVDDSDQLALWDLEGEPAGELDLSPAELTPGKIDTGAVARLENLVRSMHNRPAALTARVDRLLKEVEVSSAEEGTSFEAAEVLEALQSRSRALTELMRLVAGDRSTIAASGGTGSPDPDGTANAPDSREDNAAHNQATLVAEAQAHYNEATEQWRALRDARLEAPGNVRPAEMGVMRTSRRRIKQQSAERVREARGEPAPRPRIHTHDASADQTPATGTTVNSNGSGATARPATARLAIAPPPPPAPPPPWILGASADCLGWSR